MNQEITHLSESFGVSFMFWNPRMYKIGNKNVKICKKSWENHAEHPNRGNDACFPIIGTFENILFFVPSFFPLKLLYIFYL